MPPIHINQRTPNIPSGDEFAVAGLVEHDDMGRALPQDLTPAAGPLGIAKKPADAVSEIRHTQRP